MACYDISDMETDEIKEMIEDIYGEVDTDTDIYFILLMEELETRLSDSEFIEFYEIYKN
jgi:hypothetical protein